MKKNILTTRHFFAFLLLFVFSCSTAKNHPQPEKEKSQSEKITKIDKKKLMKEAAYLITWDIAWAATCESGLHFSYGVCLAVDTIGDIGIIAYSNFGPSEKDDKKVDKNCDPKKQNCSQEKTAKKTWKDVNPLELVMSVGLMAVVLLFF